MKRLATLFGIMILTISNAYSSENTIMNQITRRVVSGDHFSSKSESETTGTLDGQGWYIPNASEPGTHAVNRLYRNIFPFDHLNSLSTSEGSYAFEHELGYAYTYTGDGLAPIKRWYNNSLVDHLTSFDGENPSVLGYTLETTLGYGFPRFQQDCEINHTVSAGGVTIKANKVAGGTISELTWNGKQFINNYDYGRQIQTAFNFGVVGEVDNPNEAGSKYGCPGVVDAEYAQGSPIIYVTSTGSTLSTKTRPLQWTPENFVGGGTDNPVMWDGSIAKEVTINYFNGAYDAHVIKWTTTIDIPDYSPNFDWEMFTAYTTDDMTKQVAYDAEFAVEYDKTLVVPNNSCLDGVGMNLNPNAGGVINATPNGAYALGVYRKKLGGRNHFAICKYENGAGSGKYGGDATKWAVMERDAVAHINPGVYSGSAYIIVGTLADVESTMREMYLDGY